MPDATVEATVMLMVEVPSPVIEVGEKVALIPVAPAAVRVTAESNPPVTVLVMVLEPPLPAVIGTEDGDAERAKPAGAGPVSAVIRVAVGLPQPVTRSKPATAE